MDSFIERDARLMKLQLEQLYFYVFYHVSSASLASMAQEECEGCMYGHVSQRLHTCKTKGEAYEWVSRAKQLFLKSLKKVDEETMGKLYATVREVLEIPESMKVETGVLHGVCRNDCAEVQSELFDRLYGSENECFSFNWQVPGEWIKWVKGLFRAQKYLEDIIDEM